MLLDEIEDSDLQLSSAAQMYGVMMWTYLIKHHVTEKFVPLFVI